VQLSASIGVVFHSGGSISAEELLGSADVAMYAAKARGRDGHAVFNHALRDQAERRYQLEQRLRDAVRTDQLVMHYQPVVNIGSGALVGAEALIRWHDGDHGLIPAGEFIPIAEQSTLILELGAWSLGQVCAQARRWEGLLGQGRLFAMHANLSARELGASDLASRLEALVIRHGLSGSSELVVELTETAMMDNIDEAKLQLGKLKELGFRIAIDDYGTAYSTLTYLRELPVDIIKIDQSFVAGIGHDRWDERICASQIDMAHALGMTVIAEGVETERQHTVLKELGCDLAQGYWYGRPVPPDEFAKGKYDANQRAGRTPDGN
jgi:EAL domain-containing protein (putative c-di-GMP-specific phosphodiesterase class I)